MTNTQPSSQTSDRVAEIPQRSGSFQAVVRAGDAVVAYLRTGAGQPVLLLRRADSDILLWATLLERISEHFRVLIPEAMPDEASFAQWFAAFHDGLGLGPVRIVADSAYGVAVLQMALIHGDRVNRLVIFTSGAGDDVDGVLTDGNTVAQDGLVAGATGHPVLFVPKQAETHDVAIRVVKYLQGQSTPIG